MPVIFPRWSIGYVLEVMAGSYLVVAILIPYLSAISTDPGYVEPGSVLAPEHQIQGLKPPFCRICRCEKPERCHHCSICGRCVARMDHHCPWLNNCVGYHNHRNFFLFLLYLLLGAVFVLAHALYIMLDPGLGPSQLFSDTLVVLSLVICSAICLTMLMFLSWNMYLVMNNQTAIEAQAALTMKRTFNPFDLGQWQNTIEAFRTEGDARRYPIPQLLCQDPTAPLLSRWTWTLRELFRTAAALTLLLAPSLQDMPHQGKIFKRFIPYEA